LQNDFYLKAKNTNLDEWYVKRVDCGMDIRVPDDAYLSVGEYIDYLHELFRRTQNEKYEYHVFKGYDTEEKRHESIYLDSKARTHRYNIYDKKKELVAKLSHDIKSPIASIKSSSELGLEISKEETTKKQFKSINQKSDQINTLITNLFNSTLDEMEELNINPTNIKSSIIKDLINNSDYLNKTKKYTIEDCNIFADRLRLQQVFDNIYINSYKYANTDMEVKSYIKDEFLVISIKDYGDSIKKEEIPLLTEKFKRVSNVKDKDGVGLGLYISKELMKKMNGELDLDYDNGFTVIIKLRII
jgi:signal transduction histidine kinase